MTQRFEPYLRQACPGAEIDLVLTPGIRQPISLRCVALLAAKANQILAEDLKGHLNGLSETTTD